MEANVHEGVRERGESFGIRRRSRCAMQRVLKSDLFAYETCEVFVEYFNQLKRHLPSPNNLAKDVWFRGFTFLDRPGKHGQAR